LTGSDWVARNLIRWKDDFNTATGTWYVGESLIDFIRRFVVQEGLKETLAREA